MRRKARIYTGSRQGNFRKLQKGGSQHKAGLWFTKMKFRRRNWVGISQSITQEEDRRRSLTSIRSRRQLLFFDLDNTLIPTSWIMQQWDRGHASTSLATIRSAVNEAQMLSQIDGLLSSLLDDGTVDRVAVVTNAPSTTVEGFYFRLCFPELRSILQKYNVGLFSTDGWVALLGPPPPLYDVDAFKMFYTEVKYRQYEAELFDLISHDSPPRDVEKPSPLELYRKESRVKNLILNGRASANSMFELIMGGHGDLKKKVLPGRSISNASTTDAISSPRQHPQSPVSNHSPLPRVVEPVDVIAVGDQICDVSAACKLASENPCSVSLVKLALLIQPMHQTPKEFTKRLDEMGRQLLDLCKTGKHGTTPSPGQRAYWFETANDILLCVDEADKFVNHQPQFPGDALGL